MQTFTTITGADFYEALIEDSATGVTEWSINQKASVGDQVLFYVCRPYSAIIAVAQLANDVRLEDDLSNPWYGKYFAEMNNLRILKQPVERSRLLQEFPEWRYWKQPRNSILVLPEFENGILALIPEMGRSRKTSK